MNALALQRLWSQQIAAPGLDPASAVASLGAVQAQDHAAALWAIGLRSAGATRAAVEQAIRDRAIVRTWPMRGTLHFVAAPDVDWMLSLLATRAIAASALRCKQLALDDAAFAKARAVLTEALQGGLLRTRAEMMATLEGAAISTEGQRGYHILWRLSQEGLLCFGPHQGKEPTFTLLREWIPAAPSMTRETALATLARRYFRGHGPATVRDLAWWAGITLTDARAGLERVATELVCERVDDVEYWRAEAPSPPSDAPRAHLLPAFDEYLLGYTDRRAVLDPRHAPRIVPGANGIFQPMIVLDGRVVGTWRLAKTASASLTATLFEPVKKKDHRAIEDAAQRYGAFVGRLPLGVTFA